MGDRSGIEWTDATWNPVTGCTKVSPGCDNCYAASIAHRFAGTPAYPQGFTVTLRPERLVIPLRWTRPRRVFVNSTSDLFHNQIEDRFIAQVWAVMACAPRHTFQVLTKRHARLRALLSDPTFEAMVLEAVDQLRLPAPLPGTPVPVLPLPNVWIGVSAENQQWADIRVPNLLATPAAVRFVSAEPLLGPIRLTGRHETCPQHPDHSTRACSCARRAGLDWLIVGGESGPAARPMNPRWVSDLRDDATTGGVAFLFKQWGEWAPPPGGSGRATVLPDGVVMTRVGKKTAGRLLEERVWDQYPSPSPAHPGQPLSDSPQEPPCSATPTH